MENSISSFYYIKDIELFAVLASFDVKKWYGIQTDITENAISDSFQNRVINALFQKGYLTFEEDKAVLSKDFSGIVESLVASKSFLYLRRWQNDNPALLFYLSNDRAVCVERSVNDECTLKLSVCQKEELKEYILEECLEEDIVNPEEMNASSEIEMSFSDEITEDMIKEEELITVIEKFRTDTGEKIERLIVQDNGAYYTLVFQSESENKRLLNSSENRKYIIERLIKWGGLE